jgi:hypothetical protein
MSNIHGGISFTFCDTCAPALIATVDFRIYRLMRIVMGFVGCRRLLM